MKPRSLFLILAGGGFTILCFFIPWLKLDMTSIGASTYTFSVTFSGFSIAMRNLLGIIAFIAALAIIGINTYMLTQQTLWKSRNPMLFSSGIGLLCVLGVLRLLASHAALLHIPEERYQYIVIALGTQWAQTGIKPQLTDLISLQFGGFGAAIGFIVVIIGAWFLPTSARFIENSDEKVVL